MPEAGGLEGRLWALFHETWKYFLVSLASLAVDFGIFFALDHHWPRQYLIWNALSFTAGLVVNYALSVTLVFQERRLSSRAWEFAGFFAIGLAGLALNEGLIAACVGWLGLSHALSKIAAAGGSFVFNFAARRALLFTAPKGPPR
jgi:putative flippase GtrA